MLVLALLTLLRLPVGRDGCRSCWKRLAEVLQLLLQLLLLLLLLLLWVRGGVRNRRSKMEGSEDIDEDVLRL